MRRRLGTFAVAAILAAACADPASLPPDDYELPPPDLPHRSVAALQGRAEVQAVELPGVVCY